MSTFDLVELLENGDDNQRQTAAEALGNLGDIEAVSLLIAALQKEERLGVAGAIVQALGKLRDKRATPVLLELIKTSEKWRKNFSSAMATHHVLHGNIRDALANIGDKAALVQALNHKDEKVRRIAAQAIGKISNI